MGRISAQSRMKHASDRILWRAVGSETIVVNPDNGASYVLNSVGASVWELVNGERTIADITSAVCDSYDVTPDKAQKDIVEWAEWMADSGLVTVEPAVPNTVESKSPLSIRTQPRHSGESG